jgi:hypothetical protein
MPDAPNRFFIVKRLLTAAAALVAFVMASVIGGRIAGESLFKGVASSRATGLFVQAHWDSITLVESYRAPLEANLAGEFLQLRWRDLLLGLALSWCPI